MRCPVGRPVELSVGRRKACSFGVSGIRVAPTVSRSSRATLVAGGVVLSMTPPPKAPVSSEAHEVRGGGCRPVGCATRLAPTPLHSSVVVPTVDQQGGGV